MRSASGKRRLSRRPKPVLAPSYRHRPQLSRDDRLSRDELVRTSGERLHVGLVEETIRSGRAAEPKGPDPSRNAIQSVTLLDTIDSLKIDALIGGARRDEEKARAKERIFSVRDDFGQCGAQKSAARALAPFSTVGLAKQGEHMRVFPALQLDRTRRVELHPSLTRKSRSLQFISRTGER